MISLDTNQTVNILCVLACFISALAIYKMTRDLRRDAERLTEIEAQKITREHYRRVAEIMEERRRREEQE